MAVGENSGQAPFVVWDAGMSVGVKAFDDDHKRMIAIVNELHSGIVAGHRKEVLSHVLDQLAEYTAIHFAREEAAFDQCGYPGAFAHKTEHAGLVSRLKNWQARLQTGPVALLDLELMSFLRTWLVNHIQGSDRKYRTCLNAKGVF